MTAKKTLGILGGGQLAQMLVPAAHTLGWHVHVYTPEQHSPASQVADQTTVAKFTDAAALASFAQRVDMVTLEFENIPVPTLETIARLVPVHPSPSVLGVSQDRGIEKSTIAKLGVPVTPFSVVKNPQTLLEGLQKLGTPAILKTAQLGYDGKGQWAIDGPLTLAQAEAMLDECQQTYANPSGWVLEKKLNFTAECSVIVARNKHGHMATLGPFENTHDNAVLHTTVYPASGLAPNIKQQALAMGKTVAQGLAVVGLVCIEMFVTGDEATPLVVNEIAPRPHNSGHITQDLNGHSQFDRHMQALLLNDFPHAEVVPPYVVGVMMNIMGDMWFAPGSDTPAEPDWTKVQLLKEATLHLYGKTEARKGRKMGHINWVSGKQSAQQGIDSLQALQRALSKSAHLQESV